MHNEKDGFPITALREIKLLKLLSHKNVLRLQDMAVEHHSKISKLSECHLTAVKLTICSRQAQETYHVYGHALHGP